MSTAFWTHSSQNKKATHSVAKYMAMVSELQDTVSQLSTVVGLGQALERKLAMYRHIDPKLRMHSHILLLVLNC